MSTPLSNRWSSMSTRVGTRWRWFLAKPRGAVGPGRAMHSVGTGSAGMPMTEWVVFSGLLLAVIWTRVGKVVPLESLSITKHFPGAVFLWGLLLSALGSTLFFGSRRASERPLRPLRVLWPLVLLAVYIVSGSIYAQLVDKEPNTFRFAGGYMLAAWGVAYVMSISPQPLRFVKVYLAMQGFFAACTVIAMAVVFFVAAGAPFHELEFMIFPLVVYIVTRKPSNNFFELLLVWTVLASAVLFRKNTSYLVAAGTVLYLWLFHWRFTGSWRNAVQRMLYLLVGLVAAAAIIGTYVYLREHTTEFVPSGNTEFRLTTYKKAWDRFLQSPAWGDAFSAPAVEKFSSYDTGVAGNVLPTHSDLLDLLAHGGGLGVLLWLLAYGVLLYNVRKHLLSRRGELPDDLIAAAHTLTCMLLLCVLTYAFNPLWLNPTRALLVWVQVGLLAGLACCYAKPAQRQLKPSSVPLSRTFVR